MTSPTPKAQAELAACLPSRSSYEGSDGGWRDGRLGQAYDLIYAAITERGEKAFGHPLLTQIEELDGEEL